MSKQTKKKSIILVSTIDMYRKNGTYETIWVPPYQTTENTWFKLNINLNHLRSLIAGDEDNGRKGVYGPQYYAGGYDPNTYYDEIEFKQGVIVVNAYEYMNEGVSQFHSNKIICVSGYFSYPVSDDGNTINCLHTYTDTIKNALNTISVFIHDIINNLDEMDHKVKKFSKKAKNILEQDEYTLPEQIGTFGLKVIQISISGLITLYEYEEKSDVVN
jgi:hypothetical protein